MWKARAESLESKLTALKKRTSDGVEPAAKKTAATKEEPAKKAAVVKHCSVCGKTKAECKDPACQEKIAAKKAAKAK